MKKAIRATLMSLLLLVVTLPVALYLLLSVDAVQNRIRLIAVEQLSALLGTEVEIEHIDYEPFNTLAVRGISVKDDEGNPALSVAQVQARFELMYFLRTGRLEFDYAILNVPEVWISRPCADGPLNIAGIISRLAPKDKNRPPSQYNLSIATLVVRNGRLSYNVLDRPHTPGRFNPAHISVKKLALHAYLRHISPAHYDVLLESLSFNEGSGFRLERLEADAAVTPDRIDLRTLDIALPASQMSLSPATVKIDGIANISRALASEIITVGLRKPATLATSDFVCFAPFLAGINRKINLDFLLAGNLRELTVDKFSLDDSRGTFLSLTGDIKGLDSVAGMSCDIQRLDATVNGNDATLIVRRFSPEAADYVSRAGNLSLRCSLAGTMQSASVDLTASVAGGSIDLSGSGTFGPGFSAATFTGDLSLNDIAAGTVLDEPRLGDITVPARIDLDWQRGSLPVASMTLSEASVQWLGKTYRGLFARLGIDPVHASLQLASPNPGASIVVQADAAHSGAVRSLDLSLEIDDLQPALLGLPAPRPGMGIAGLISADLEGSGIDDINGRVSVSDMMLTSGSDTLAMKSLEIESSTAGRSRSITIAGDYINGSLEGRFTPSLLNPVFKEIASKIVPAIVPPDSVRTHMLDDRRELNNFTARLTLADAEHLCRFFHTPVTVIYPVTLDFALSALREELSFTLDAPYLQQGDKIIDGTTAALTVQSASGDARLFASTHMPTKKGPMALSLGISGADDIFNTTINWEIERAIPLNGVIGFDTSLARNVSGGVCVSTDMRPGRVNFGDDVWAIEPANISWCDSRLTVDNFVLNAGNQRIAIEGAASARPDDRLTIDLRDIVLVSIFETLEIENALLTGTATGTFTATDVFSGFPRLSTPCLHVNDIGYNYCVLGDADVKASWDGERQGFRLDADIVNPEGLHSTIGGYIFPAGESLDLDFNARYIKVGFMQPFMKAFASDITGFASGHARLFGTFHDIDMEGDIYAQDLRLRLDFTNTYYHTTDSIHIRPGIIRLDNIILRDEYDHTARLDGVLTHTFFHLPEFDFRISEATDFLCYNVTPRINPDWYGTVYGNGGATVKGRPGVIDIGVNMSTRPGSTFTFVLSDRLEAEQYSFITFNDVTDYAARASILTRDDTPEAVREYQERMKKAAEDPPSNYIMDIMVDITPDAQVNLVMDPVGGDCIKAFGSGDLRMTYNAFENDLRMYGTYTLDRGSYNFTLQDIIIKDFTIEPGSSIAFRGDPYSAQLNLEAVYQVNANLSDLDESFTQDKDLNRTNVPVQALMKVTGDMRQPDLDFDLRFPTLTSDTYRKVRSIISTDEMMNRQIIYLLALNRFYTPDYMDSTTKGNQLFSVASSTIASQLSSMLGKLSDNWSIAPNLRSDRGDFSDVEVDVALSSRLLNNRLLFNGNFGYRDKSLNTNQFIGDFDIEYLINPRGNWRLKAYNRYNDQNYYVRSAATTQGVGIMFRRDFDDLFGRRREPCPQHTDTIPASDTIQASGTELPSDTIPATH